MADLGDNRHKLRIDESLPQVIDIDARKPAVEHVLLKLSEAEDALAEIRVFLHDVIATGSKNIKHKHTIQMHEPCCDVQPCDPSSIVLHERGICVTNANEQEEKTEEDDVQVEGNNLEAPSVCETKAPDGDLIASVSLELNLPRDQVSSIHRVFIEANKSCSGQLTTHELEDFLVELCEGMIDTAQIQFIMNKFDVNGNGSLGFAEFVSAFVSTPLMKVLHLENQVRETAGKAREQAKEHGFQDAKNWNEMMECKASSLKRYVRKELSEASSCLSMPWVIAMFLLYYASTLMHLNYEQLYAVDHAIYYDLTENGNFAFSGAIPLEQGRMGHKNFYDVNSFADFWSWFDLGLIPLLWPTGWDVNEYRGNVAAWCDLHGTNTSTCINDQMMPRPQRPADFYGNGENGTYLYYNTIVGGVRLRQERDSSIPCSSDLKNLQHGSCLTGDNFLFVPDLISALSVDKSLLGKKGGETMYLPSSLSQTAVRQKIRDLENQVWASPYTAKLEIMFTTFNAHYDVFSVTNMFFFVNRAGHFYKTLMPTSFYLTPYRNPAAYLVDALMVLLTLKIVFEEGADVYYSCKAHGCKIGLKLYVEPANVVDWINVLYFAVVASAWLLHVGRIGNLKDILRDADIRMSGNFADQGELQRYYEYVDVAVSSEVSLRAILAIFPFIIGLRFFKVFSLQPRLGVVTATFRSAFKDLVHFAVVFFCIFVVFVEAARILWGHQMQEFTNFGRAFNTVFRVLHGEYDWDEMVRIGRVQSCVWFWSFTWVVNFVMLNMLLAIVVDTYTSVRGNIPGDAESLWSQMYEIWVRWNAVRTGRQVSMKTVLDALLVVYPDEGEQVDETLGVQGLMRVVANLPQDQAVKILVDTYENYDGGGTTGCTMSETHTRVKHIFKGTQNLHRCAEHSATMIEGLMELCKIHFQETRNQIYRDTSPQSRCVTRSAVGESSTTTRAFLRLHEKSGSQVDV